MLAGVRTFPANGRAVKLRARARLELRLWPAWRSTGPKRAALFAAFSSVREAGCVACAAFASVVARE